jgi:hypothetical protein
MGLFRAIIATFAMHLHEKLTICLHETATIYILDLLGGDGVAAGRVSAG